MPIPPSPVSSSQMRIVNSIPMVDLPGGVFAMGSELVHRPIFHPTNGCKPRMVRIDPFAVGVTPITEDQYRETVGRAGDKNHAGNYPANKISVTDSKEFLQKRNQGKPDNEQIRFLTEAELEYITRGPAIDVRQLMEKKGIRGAAALATYLTDDSYYSSFDNLYYLENFVSALDLGATIIATPESPGFKELIDGASPVFAWRVWGSRSGMLGANDTAFEQDDMRPVSLTKRVNDYGVSDVMGWVASYAADRYQENAYEILPPENPYNKPLGDSSENIVLRCCGLMYPPRGEYVSPRDIDPWRAAYRGRVHPDNRYYYAGLRVGASHK